MKIEIQISYLVSDSNFQYGRHLNETSTKDRSGVMPVLKSNGQLLISTILKLCKSLKYANIFMSLVNLKYIHGEELR
jgi:phage-related protein